MAVTKDEILDAISKMSVMEVVELIADMEKKFGVTAAAPVAAAAAPAPAAAEHRSEGAVGVAAEFGNRDDAPHDDEGEKHGVLDGRGAVFALQKSLD